MYLKVTNGIPEKYTIGQLRRDNPQTSFPKHTPDDMLESYGVYRYDVPPYAGFDTLTHTKSEGDFEQDAAGNWSLPFVIEQLPQEQAESNVRARRDGLLQETDWIVAKSYERGEPVPSDWASYRQALRDITAQAGFPYSVVWPTKP